MQELWEMQDLKEKPELMDHEVWLVLWGLLDQVDQMERRERLDLQDRQADEGLEELLVPLEILAPLVLLDSPDPLDLMVSPE